jgi:hypothetical protein
VDGDGFDDLAVAAGFLGGPRVAVYDGQTLFSTGTPPKLVPNDFFAFDGPDAVTLRNGVFAVAGDVDGDGFDDLIFGGGPGGGPRMLVVSGQVLTAGAGITAAHADPLANFFDGDPASRGGARVAARDVNGDFMADVAAGSRESEPSRVRVYVSVWGTIYPALPGGGSEPIRVYTQRVLDLDPYGMAMPGGVIVG